ASARRCAPSPAPAPTETAAHNRGRAADCRADRATPAGSRGGSPAAPPGPARCGRNPSDRRHPTAFINFNTPGSLRPNWAPARAGTRPLAVGEWIGGSGLRQNLIGRYHARPRPRRMPLMPLEIRPAEPDRLPDFAGVVEGIDLSRPIGPEEVAAIAA